ncbi:MAG: homoserine O-acetyltransferase, partial [Candidatus Omnitrophota bacterium]
MKDAGIGVVRTHKIVFAKQSGQNRSGALELDSGEKLESFTLAYETYGALNSDRTNAILVLHALSGDAHAAGFHEGQDKPGWWDPMIGPGRAIDTDRFFVICSNVIGGCKGSTGPACEDPETGRPYALNFPVITIGDMVRAQARLVEHLGIRKLFGVVGGSMGGMQALEWVATYPERIECVVPIATALKHTPQQIAFNEVGRQAIMADPDWNGGNYYDRAQKPQRGLGVARMIGHITYMSDASMEQKFSRRLKDKDPHFKFTADFEVEGYLQHRGDSFVKRFDANSYLYITKAIDFFDLSGSRLLARRAPEHLKFLVIAFKSDWLYPPHQVEEIV